jgi:hypothetical protein
LKNLGSSYRTNENVRYDFGPGWYLAVHLEYALEWGRGSNNRWLTNESAIVVFDVPLVILSKYSHLDLMEIELWKSLVPGLIRDEMKVKDDYITGYCCANTVKVASQNQEPRILELREIQFNGEPRYGGMRRQKQYCVKYHALIVDIFEHSAISILYPFKHRSIMGTSSRQ